MDRLFKKLLFKLHLRNTYPTYMTGLDGSKVPCTMIRTNGESVDIRPIIPPGLPRQGSKTIHFTRYAPLPPEK